MSALAALLSIDSSLVVAFAPPFALAFALAWALSSLGSRFALSDDGSDAPERKLQRRPVPLVGGIVLLVVLVLWEPIRGCLAPPVLLPMELESAVAGRGAIALLAAFALGLVDDLVARGLSAAVKLAAHVALAALCAWHAHDRAPDANALALAISFLATLLALQACNTFDNADGALTSLSALAFAPVSIVASAPLLGFLPFNLWLRRRAPDGSSTPRAYLGDSGSHLLGIWIALVPPAWPALLVPLLDLARLSILRLRRGSRPWIGDRRHLAHRFQALGWGPSAVVAALLAISAPAIAGGAFAAHGAWILPAGLAATTAAFVLAVKLTPDPQRIG